MTTTKLERPAKYARAPRATCNVDDCTSVTTSSAGLCRKHRSLDARSISRLLSFKLRNQLLDVPFRGHYSTYPEDHEVGYEIDHQSLYSLESYRLIEPVAVERTLKWGYALTEFGRQTVLIIRSRVTKGTHISWAMVDAAHEAADQKTLAQSQKVA